jgi:hypothetical protein
MVSDKTLLHTGHYLVFIARIPWPASRESDAEACLVARGRRVAVMVSWVA